VYFAEGYGNRVEEIPSTSGTQWGQPMTAGDLYTVAGDPTGTPGDSADGTAAASTGLNDPEGVAVDQAGNLFIADTGNDRVIEIPVASGSQWGGIALTAGEQYTVAGVNREPGTGADNVSAAGSDLNGPESVAAMPPGGASDDSLLITDSGNNRIQEVAATGGSRWNQSMTAGDVYTVAGSATGVAGDTGDGGVATAAR